MTETTKSETTFNINQIKHRLVNYTDGKLKNHAK